MTVESKDLITLVTGIAWPIVAVIALLVFHKPLARFVEELGKRTTKFSAFDISIEMAPVPNPPAPWEDPTIYEGSNLTGGAFTTTTVMELFQRIRDGTTWHYLIVDIGDGKRWLISRLFIFTVILRYMGGLSCVVFVETKNEHSKRLLGITHPEKIRIALAQRYPWLDQALVNAWVEQQVPVLTGPLMKDKAESIVNGFIADEKIQYVQQPKNEDEELENEDIWEDELGDQDEWEQLGDQGLWEHTKWLDIEILNRDLRGAFYDRDISQFADSPDISDGERNSALLRRQVPFIALINEKGEFKGLVDRQNRLEKLAERLGKVSDNK